MQLGDLVELVTQQFTDGRGIDAITERDSKLVVRTHYGNTIAKVVAIHANGNFDVELDDGQIWTLNGGKQSGSHRESTA